jgi:hypothetical protein
MAYRQLPGQADGPRERPQAVQPIEEHYAGVNFPYRGTEQHGVAVPADTKYDTREFQYEEEEPEKYLPGEPEPDPILVKVVQDHAREIREFRVVRIPVSQTPVQLVGKNLSRRSLRIRNTDTVNAIYIGPDPSVNLVTGFKIPGNTEPNPFVTTEAVYATTGDSSVVEVSILFEYVVEL